MANGNEPVWKLRQGALSAAAWSTTRSTANGGSFEALSVRIERRYKDANGAWQSTNSYSLNELMTLEHFVRRIIDELLEREGEAA